jgi:hypothetical protein
VAATSHEPLPETIRLDMAEFGQVEGKLHDRLNGMIRLPKAEFVEMALP